MAFSLSVAVEVGKLKAGSIIIRIEARGRKVFDLSWSPSPSSSSCLSVCLSLSPSLCSFSDVNVIAATEYNITRFECEGINAGKNSKTRFSAKDKVSALRSEWRYSRGLARSFLNRSSVSHDRL